MDTKFKESLPIFKHFEEGEVKKSLDTFRKGEFTLFSVMKLLALAAVAWGLWVYVIPIVFIALAKLTATIITVGVVVTLGFMAPIIIKGIRRLTRYLHKMVIKHDPFGELYDQLRQMKDNVQRFIKAAAKIYALYNKMKEGAAQAKANAQKFEKALKSTHKKASEYKATMESLVAQHGDAAAKDLDEYHEAQTGFYKLVQDSKRYETQYEQQKGFVDKYDVRAATMKKLGRKLDLVKIVMDGKVSDFDSTIKMLQDEFEFAKNSKEATQAAKDAMMFDTGWELDFALDTITATVAEDLFQMNNNLNDIDKLTSGEISLDSDELFDSLDKVVASINMGNDPIPTGKKHENPNYKLTKADMEIGGFGDLNF